MNEITIWHLLILIILFLIIFTDWKKYLIPNWMVLTLLLFIISRDFRSLNPEYFYLPCFALTFFIVFRKIMSKRLNRESMGFGDIKLITVLSLGMSVLEFLTFIWIASLFALTANKFLKKEKIPFGAYLALVYHVFLFNFLNQNVILNLTSF